MHPKRSETKGQRRIARQALVIFVLCLFLNLPVVSALQISNVRAENITANSAVIRWETDAPADGFVEYGLKKETLQRTGDANLLTDHQFLLSNLHAETAYLYKVESDDVSEDNDGNLYPFTTLPPDVTAPLLEASLPPRVQGTKMTFSGSSEPGASIALLVNGVTSGTAVADSAGNFSFSDVILQGDQNNEIRLTARDAAGNEAVLTQGVFSDIHKPKITFEKIPEVVEDDSFTLKGTISENSSFEIVANNKSAALGEGTTVEATISLEEGENKITILLTDAAGWEAEEMFTLVSDTKKPFIDAEIERGHEYYEGRAQSSIHGTTEPGSMVFLYIYKPLGYEFKPDFKQARAVATADEKGEFTFEDVNFARTIADITLEDLVPKEVPPGLAEVTIFPIKEVAEQQQFSYYVYLIAEDTTGKTDFWQETVTVLACGSGLDFSVTPGFQGPLRLVPELIDNGQQKISTVLEFSYRGSGVAKMANGEEVEKGYKITSIRVDKACTKSMQEDEEFGIGCKILPNAPQTRIVSPDGASAYLEWKLHSSEEFTKSEDDFWNDLKKRRVVFPLKITINYQERQGDETYSGQKVQTTCTDVGYLVDIPANVEEFIPDNILDGSIDFLNETITVMEKVTEVVKNVYLYTAISAVVALGLQQVARWGRILSSKLEYYFTVVKAGKEEGEGCPLNQNELYMKDTIDDWQGVKNIPKKVAEASGDEEKLKKITLEERCPTTAGWWEFEEITNTVYRWTWDRAYCREVPARWTEDKEVEEIQKVILSQQQCAVTGRGVPLQKQENCRDLVRQNPAALPLYYSVNNVSTSCWKTVDGTLYVRKSESLETPQEKEDTKHGIFRLVPVGTILGELVPSREDLIAFKPEGAEDYFVARDQTCQNVCSNPRKPNYKSVGCVAEELQSDGTIQIKVKEGQYAAGYTKDCRPFARGSLQSSQVQQQPQDAGQVAPPGGEIAAAAQEAAKAAAQVAVQQSSQQLQYDASGRPTFEQCVCEGEKEEVQKYENQDYSLRTAEPEEEWSYREERIFKESIKQKGTYYPEQRYYDGRDFSGAFGANYLIDYFREEPREASIKPHASDTVMPFQTICLSQIFKQLQMWQSFLVGLRGCLVQAKTTGEFDAGMCKALFTQHVCGLAYKFISQFTNSCSPSTFDDVGKEGVFGDVGTVFTEGADAAATALQSTIDDVKEDYGNTAFNQYFKAGAQGFAQSMCMAAFGLETPVWSEDFLLDAAYSQPMQSSIAIIPAERELSTYNPARGTTIHNYQIGGFIMPGCNIKRWNVKLKCIGPEDLGGFGVDQSCLGQGCDCLNAQSTASPFESEKTTLLKSEFNLKPPQFLDIPLEPIIPIDSHYRYDHVMVELELDQSEKGNEDKCFDTQAIQQGKGVYYFPLKDVSPPAQFECKADLASGRYLCPELSGMFGFGGAYLESPYVTCWNKQTETWTDCTTPNLFVAGDEIRVRAHINNDEKGKCLKRTVQPPVAEIGEELILSIPENVPGPYFRQETLGIVSEAMFGGVANVLRKISAESNLGCKEPAYTGSPADVSAGKYIFKFIKVTDTTVRLILPSGVEPLGQYSRDGTKLVLGTKDTFTIEEINDVEFDIQDFKVKAVLGSVSPSDEKNQCVFEVGERSLYAQSANARNIQVSYELLERDEAGLCTFAKIPVKAAQGKSKHTQSIRIQRAQVTLEEVGGLHDSFMKGNYDQVQTLAVAVINKLQGDLDNALAIYYYIASMIMKGKSEGDETKYATVISNLLKAFFSRDWGGQDAADYGSSVVESGEYQKIKTYLCEVDTKYGSSYQQYCG